MNDPDIAKWGFFRRPMLLGPAVGFLAFLGSEAIKSPASGGADGLIGALIAWPFALVLNWIPSATADPRFNFVPMLVGGAVAGGYCAAFFSEADSGAP